MSPDFLELLLALSAADAHYLVVEAYAVGVRLPCHAAFVVTTSSTSQSRR